MLFIDATNVVWCIGDIADKTNTRFDIIIDAAFAADTKNETYNIACIAKVNQIASQNVAVLIHLHGAAFLVRLCAPCAAAVYGLDRWFRIRHCIDSATKMKVENDWVLCCIECVSFTKKITDELTYPSETNARRVRNAWNVLKRRRHWVNKNTAPKSFGMLIHRPRHFMKCHP